MRKLKSPAMLATVITVIVVMVFCLGCSNKQALYEEALSDIKKGDLEAASQKLNECGDIEDASTLSASVDTVIENLKSIDYYLSKDPFTEEQKENVNDMTNRIKKTLPEYSEDELKQLNNYANARYLEDSQESESLCKALEAYQSLGDYRDCEDRIQNIEKKIAEIVSDAEKRISAGKDSWTSIEDDLLVAKGDAEADKLLDSIASKVGAEKKQKLFEQTISNSSWCNYLGDVSAEYLYILYFDNTFSLGDTNTGHLLFKASNGAYESGVFTWSFIGENSIHIYGTLLDPTTQSNYTIDDDIDITLGNAVVDDYLLTGKSGSTSVDTLEFSTEPFKQVKNKKWCKNQEYFDNYLEAKETATSNDDALN